MSSIRITFQWLSLVVTMLLSPLTFAETFSFRHYKAEHGLSHNTVSKIIQDKTGFIWIATGAGLNRFDGHRFKTYMSSFGNNFQFESNAITDLLEDDNGSIWVGTDYGVYIVDPRTEEIKKFNKTADNIEIRSTVNNMVKDSDGDIWISTHGQGIFHYQQRTGKLYQYRFIIDGNNTFNFDLVNHIYVDNSNQVWAAPKSSKHPLLIFDSKKKCFRFYPLNYHSDISVYKIFEDSNGILWFGSWDKGIFRLNKEDKSITKYLSPEHPGGILHIHEICEYKPNKLLIGSDDGLSLFDTNTGSHQLYTSSEIDPYSISDKFIYPIMIDREGGIWIGTYFGGVNYVSPNSGLFERHTYSHYENSVNGKVIAGFTEDKEGNIWIASDDGGLNRMDIKTGKFTSFMPVVGKNSLSYYNVHALCWDNNDLWIGTYSGGLNVLNTSSGVFKHYNHNPTDTTSLDGGSIYAIYKDRNDRLWIGTMSGINMYNRSTDDFTRIKQTNTTTIDIKQDNNGWLWFATLGKGVYRFNPQTAQWREYTIQPGVEGSLPSNIINCMHIDARAQLWLGTTNGLCRYDYTNDAFIYYKLNITSEIIYCIIEDDNYLWLTTSKGLVRYNTDTGKTLVFRKSDGLISDQFITNSGFKSSTGKIYVGTANGFNSFYPKQITINDKKPDVAITGLEIFNQPVAVDPKGPLKESIVYAKQIDLNYKQNVFTLSFVALSYITPEKTKYAYKLEGFDKEWTYVDHANSATYTNLPAGNYTFRVKASGNNGNWNEDGASIRLVIHPPFWLSKGFMLLYLLVCIALLITVIRYFRGRTEKKHQEKIKEIKQEKEKEVYNAKIQFFTMIAHEIRTPVSLIIAPLEKMLTGNHSFSDSTNKELNIINRNSQRLLQLVNQLLDFRKVEQGVLALNYSKHNLFQLLCTIIDRFKPVMEHNKINFSLDCPTKELEAVIDQEAFTKIISNLFTNAIKFTNGQIHLTCKADNAIENFEIRVSDNGSGVSDLDKQKIFEPFYQVHSMKEQGTGLGLSVVRSLVEAHKGSVSVADAYPEGTILIVSLPINPPNSNSLETICEAHEITEEHETFTPELKQIEKNKPTLLIVEDSPDMSFFLCDSLSEDYNVISASDGIIALEQLHKKSTDIIISDLMMPNMNGLELCKNVKSTIALSHIPVVILTAKTDIDSKIDGLNLGADSYIEKPFSIAHLKAQLKNLIDCRKMLRKKFAEMPFVAINTIARSSADEQFLSKANEIIEQNISNEDFNIELLAEGLCISRSGLFAKIKHLAEMTPNELIQLIRLKKAAEYLLQNEFRINEVAYMVGFSNPSYFSKCFQKQFGVKPGDFALKTKANCTAETIDTT
jgi:signal transduction histidine kinase/ligand-binding sensor domain-containing protein/DNA-binding response OmpR family regulator